MSAIIITGQETGLLDSSFALLDRDDRTAESEPGHGQLIAVNAANGNLILQQQDAFLPSFGDDFLLVRTYNQRGGMSDAGQHTDSGWSWTTSVHLQERQQSGETYYVVAYGDGSLFEYRWDAARELYVSKDGAGAYETLETLNGKKRGDPAFAVTRADQTRLTFDQQGNLLRWEDTNGVRMDYVYKADRLVQVLDDDGHVINFNYASVDVDADDDIYGKLVSITDETEGVLVSYVYDADGRLAEVTDRHGHVTRYFYTASGQLSRVVLPNEQTVGGALETYETRELHFAYEEVNWGGGDSGQASVLTSMTDAEGNVTTFDYAFDFRETPPEEDSRRGGRANVNPDVFFNGGTTTVTDALGHNRAYSNDQQYQDWRTANGFYGEYDAAAFETDVDRQEQVGQILARHALTYSYDRFGQVTEVVDQQGYRTTYVYDDDGDLTSVTDRNGWAVVRSDSDYYRALRAELGYVNLAGLGKLVADLTPAETDALVEAFTSHFTYDERGNLLTSADNAGNVVSFTYTGFNKVATTTSAVGNALVTSDDAYAQAKRAELGYAALVADLSPADIEALLALHTAEFAYDANQNLVKRTDAGGDVTLFHYDGFGNLTHQIVLLDPALDVPGWAGLDQAARDAQVAVFVAADADEVQITQFFYDGFGNNVETVDGEGNHTFSDYDHFGNLTRFVDGNGGVTTFTYDADDRLLTVTDPEGHVTANAYDAVGNRISVTDENGHTVTQIYDRNNRLITVIDPSETGASDRRSEFEYDVVGNATRTVDAKGRETEFVWDARRQLVEVIGEAVEDYDLGLTRYRSTFAYDGEGNQIRSTNNRGFTTEILYAANGLVRRETDAGGQVTEFTYDANDNAVVVVVGAQLEVARRQVLRFGYDEEDQLVRSTDAEGGVTALTYDAVGNTVAVTDANGNALVTSDDAYAQAKRAELGYAALVANLSPADIDALLALYTTEFEYDRNNRLLKEIRPEVADPANPGQTVRYVLEHVFDANGNEIETIDENGNSTRFTFDKDDRQVMVEDANGIKTVFTYDSRDNRTSVQIGVDATVVKDAQGRFQRIDVTGADEAQVTTYVYDEFNQLVSLTDGVGNALAGSELTLYREMRFGLGYVDGTDPTLGRTAADLTDPERDALRALHTSHFEYDLVGNLVRETDNEGRVTEFEFDAIDRLIKETNALGTAQQRATTFGYDGNANLRSITDAVGHALITSDSDHYKALRVELGYAALVADLSDADKEALLALRTTTTTYDALDRVETLTDPKGTVTRREYDSFGNLTAETLAESVVLGDLTAPRRSEFEYDLNNRIVKTIDPEGHDRRFEYDAVGNRIREVDARGGATGFVYDALNRVVKIIDPLTFETRFEYDGVGNRISLEDANGGITKFTYDAGNRYITTEDAEGRITTFTYDRQGRSITQTTAYGTPGPGSLGEERTQYFYDAEGNLSKVIDAEGGVYTSKFDRVYNRTESVDANGNKSVYTFDALNRQLLVAEAFGTAVERATTFAYDAVDNLLSRTDANGHTTTFAYDANGQVIRQTDPLGVETHFAYDAVGNQVSITRAANVPGEARTTVFVYDKDDRLTAQIDPIGRTDYVYDANDNLTRQTDAEGNTTSYAYDANDRVISVVDPIGHARAHSDDQEFRSWRLANGFGEAPYLETDGADPLATDYAAIQAIYDTQRTRFSYDDNGNRTTVEDANGNVTTTYYNANNEVEFVVDALGYVTSNEYDANGNVIRQIAYDTALTAPVAPGVPPVPVSSALLDRETNYEYDALNRIVAVVDPEGGRRTFTYDALGNQLSVTDENVHTTTFTYDALNQRISQISAVGNALVTSDDAYYRALRFELGYVDPTDPTKGKTVAQLTDAEKTALLAAYTRTSDYDAVGNLIRETDENGNVVRFAYDDNDRRIAQLTAEGVLTIFEYDALGNLTASREQVGTFTPNPDGSIPLPPSAAPAPAVAQALVAFTASSTVGSERTTTYTYDANGRLLTETSPTGLVTTYEYRPNGLLKSATQVSPDGTRQLEQRYDDRGLLVEEEDARGVITRYQLDSVGNVLQRIEAFGTPAERITTYAYDGLNRITKETDALGHALVTSDDAVHVQKRLELGYRSGLSDGKTVSQLSQAEKDELLDLYSTTYTYDGDSSRVEIRTRSPGAGERLELFEYNLDGRLTAQINGEGERTEFRYDSAGNRTHFIVAPGLAEEREVRFEYDAQNRLTAEIDGEGVRTEYVWDGVNKLSTTQAAGLAGQERITVFVYNDDDQLVSVTDPEGEITTYSYDTHGNRENIVGPDGTVTVNTFDAYGRLLTNIVGANTSDARGGIKTENVYDDNGNLKSTTVSWADGSDARTTTYDYDLLNRQTRVTDGEGFATLFEYDAFGNVTKVTRGAYFGTDAAKIAATFNYTDPSSGGTGGGYVTNFVYDELNNLLTTTDGNGNVVRSEYDAFGNRTAQITGERDGSSDQQHISRLDFDFDLAGRLVERRSATGGKVKLTYDEAGNLTQQETLQSVTGSTEVWSTQTFEYDGNGRETAMIETLNRSESRSESARTEYHFDAVGNLTSTIYAHGTAVQRTVSSTFDLNNNRLSDIDALGNVTTYAYDAAGRLIKETDALGAVTRHYYDDFGRRQATLDGRNFLTGYSHDSGGNLLTETLYMTAVTGAVNDGDPLPVPVADAANDRVTVREYDGAGRVTRETAPDLSYKTYHYDSTDKLVRKEQHASTDPTLLALTENTAARVVSWVYDGAGRLATFTNVDGVVETYTYDSANNKVEDRIHNPNPLPDGSAEPDKITAYTYDFSNRLTQQLFDPSGLALSQVLSYDKAGNVVSRTDGNGHVTYTDYDLANRAVKVTDPLGSFTRYAYDLVGNLTRFTDARGNATEFEYDDNNRLIRQIGTQRTAHWWNNGTLITGTVTPTTVNSYDAVGNLRQVTDPGGNVTTYWYDASGNLVAERDDDGALKRFEYDAANAVRRVIQDMTFATATVDLATAPVASSSVREATNFFDRAGRVTSTAYSTIAIVGDASFTPTSVSEYDAFGNQVRSTDAGGNETVAYYDLRGRQVALVNADGYLVESDYDSQGNLVQQRKYETSLTSGQDPANRPGTSSLGAPVTLDRIYDAAGRLIEEISPEVHTTSGDLRVVTTFAYDGEGNVTRRTLGAATINSLGVRTLAPAGTERTEYTFYDDANRRVGVVDANRVLTRFTYDVNGNVTGLKRVFTQISAADLASAAAAKTLPSATLDAANDQERIYQYDAANRLIQTTSKIDNARNGTPNDVVVDYGYDQNGNRTYSRDAEGNETETLHNARGDAIRTETPNGGYAYVEYDPLGFKVRTYTGDDGTPPVPAGGFSAGVEAGAGGDVRITWSQPDAGVTSWVVWDSVSRSDPASGQSLFTAQSSGPGNGGIYTHASGAGAPGTGSSVSTTLSGASGQIYFRVVSERNGNLTWTAEQSLYIPPRIQTIEMAPAAGGDYTGTVTFDSAVNSVTLRDEANNPAPGSSADGGSTWTFTVSGDKDDLFTIEWEPVAGGSVYISDPVALLAASGGHSGAFFVPPGPDGTVQVTWTVPSDGSGNSLVGDEQLVIVDGVALPAADAWRSNDDLVFEVGGAEVAAADSARYDVFYGTRWADAHAVDVSFEDSQDAQYTLDDYLDASGNVVQDQNDATQSRWNRSWVSDSNATVTTTISATLNASELANIGPGGLMVAYRVATAGVDFAQTVPLSGDPRSATVELDAGQNYDLKVYYLDLNGDEVIVEWQRVTVPAEAADVSNAGTVTRDGTSPPPQSSRNVPVGTPLQFTGNSLTVSARETDGLIDRAANDDVTVTPGDYVGPLGASAIPALTLSAPTVVGASSEASISSDPSTARTYYTEYQYNNLGIVIATNENDGVWREYKLDANGNVVETWLFGTQTAAEQYAQGTRGPNIDPMISYKTYDNRGNETSSTNAESETTTRTYDYAGRVASIDDPGGGSVRTFDFDGAGNLVSFNNATNHTTDRDYSVFGELVRENDFAGNVHHKVYDGAGRLMEEHTAGVSDHQYYNHDAFGRRIQVARGAALSDPGVWRSSDGTVSGNVTAYFMSYDQRDRLTEVETGNLISVTDSAGAVTIENEVTRYYYDRRDNRVWTEDAEGRWFGVAYDAMGLVAHRYSFQEWRDNVDVGDAPTTLAEAKQWVANSDVTLVDLKFEYDVFANRYRETDAEGRVQSFSYGAFGRLASHTKGDLTVSTGYDRFGRKTSERSNDVDYRQGAAVNIGSYDVKIDTEYDDADRITQIWDRGTATRTRYTYDAAGRRDSEVLERTPDNAGTWIRIRSYAYAYDANGRMTRWTDSESGVGERFVYDGNGNVTQVTGEKTGDNNFFVNDYTYDAADRVTDAAGKVYTYDLRGRIHTADGETYTYDDADRVISAGATLKWEYDKVGNVTKFTAADGKVTTYYYDANNVSYKSAVAGGDTSVTYFDRSGRVLESTTGNARFVYEYHPDGTEKKLSVSGKDIAANSSKPTYDANGKLVGVALGKSDSDDAVKNKSFTYDNEGRIIERVFDGTTTYYLYVAGEPVGEYTDAAAPVLDTGSYSVIKEVSDKLPATAVAEHVVAAGQTLESIAGLVYGHPELWFVIAEANGLTGSEQLKEGMRLIIPNSVQFVGNTSETQALYKESEIVGSTLPNLAAPPPSDEEKCAKIAAIVLVVVVAIAAVALTVFTVGAAGPAAFGAVAGATTFAAAVAAGASAATLAAAVFVTVVVTAAIGAAIAFAASAATQGILVGFKLQESFDWDAVAADTVAGAFSGAAAGLGVLASGVAKVTTTVRLVNAGLQAGLEVGGEALRQKIVNGEVNDYAGLAIAGAGGAVGSIGDTAEGARKANQAALKTLGATKPVTRVGKVSSALAKSRFVQGAKGLAGSLQGAATSAARAVTSRANRIGSLVGAGVETLKVAVTSASKTRLGKLGLALGSPVLLAGAALGSPVLLAGAVGYGATVAAKRAGKLAADLGTRVGQSSFGKFAKKNLGFSLTGSTSRNFAERGQVVLEEAVENSRQALKKLSVASDAVTDDAIAALTKAARREEAIELTAKFGVLYPGLAVNAAWGLDAETKEAFGIGGFDPGRKERVGRESAFRFGAAGASGILTGLGRAATITTRSRENVEIADGLRQTARQEAAARAQELASRLYVRQRSDQVVDTDDVALAARMRTAQTGWTPTSWLDTALDSVTQIVTQLQGVPDLATALKYNRVLAGETADFAEETLLEVASNTAGRIGTHPVAPLPLLNNAAPKNGYLEREGLS